MIEKPKPPDGGPEIDLSDLKIPEIVEIQKAVNEATQLTDAATHQLTRAKILLAGIEPFIETLTEKNPDIRQRIEMMMSKKP